MSAKPVYQPLHWRERCWAHLPGSQRRGSNTLNAFGDGCTRYRRPGFLTCCTHADREGDARRLYLTTGAPELEGVDRARVVVEVNDQQEGDSTP